MRDLEIRNESIVCRRGVRAGEAGLESTGTGSVLGWCGSESGPYKLRGALGVQESLLHEFTRADSFHFTGVFAFVHKQKIG